jgi:uncharacterized protein (TIGR03435 family)
MLQTLLAERFQLAFHRTTKLSSGYVLVAAKNGLKIDPVETGERNTMNWGRGRMTAERVSMAKLADTLSRMLGSPVVDMTSIQGIFSFKLEWTPESAQRAAGPDGAPTDAVLGPSLFTVLQQELGLKLEPKKEPIEVFIIDKAEKPSEN